MSALEIHELTRVPRTKVYEITQKMILRGMCIKKVMGRKKKYQAVEPKRAFNNLIQEYQNDLDERKELAKTMGKVFYPLYNQGMQSTDVSEYIEIISDLPSIHERYVSLVKNTKFEQLGFVKPPYAYQYRRKKLKEQENVEFKILKKGAVVRVLYEYPAEEDLETTIAHIKKCIAAGEKARVIEKLPIKMYVFDRRYVLMALDNGKSAGSSLTMLVVEHPALAMAVGILFDHLWEKAQDYKTLKSLLRKTKKMA